MTFMLPEINEEPQNVLHNKGGDGSPASISAATGVSELEVVLQQKTFTRLVFLLLQPNTVI